LPDIVHPAVVDPVQFRAGCNGLIARGKEAIYPDNCPGCGKAVRVATVHSLKSLPHFFTSLVDSSKTFEIRKNDRNYRVGDTLRLREWNADTEQYSGFEVTRVVIYITAFAQQPGWVVMGIRE
jgi:hypothetical protein